MKFEIQELSYDVCVVGGGLSGVCAAIAAARLGSRVALINNRGYIGGNASAEMYITVNGATGAQEFNFFAREDGIIEEILLENLHRNPEGNRYIWDAVLLDFIFSEKNIDLYLNTTVFEAETEDERILCVLAVSSVCEQCYRFFAPVFIDDTGDGTLGWLAGANYAVGRESRETYGEQIAPETADDWVQPSTLVFYGRDIGRPVKYIPPSFAMDIEKDTKLLQNRVIPPNSFARNQWYYELGGDKDQTHGMTDIMNEQRSFVYGVWDHIKNSGKYPADNYDLAYVSCMPAKREWRRLRGDVVLTENDLVNQTQFEDVIAYGGWSIDLHALEGVYSDDIQNRHFILKGIFRIPFRACYSENISNLLVASRCLSASHVAHGSTRLIATLCMIGHAVGAAAHLCSKKGIGARELYEKHMDELRFVLTRDGHTVLGIPYRDEADLAQGAKITVSSTKAAGITEADGEVKLDFPMALVMPTGNGLNSISLFCRASEDTELKINVYLPSNHESYNPETLIYQASACVSRSDSAQRVILPLCLGVEDRYVFIQIEQNSNLFLAFSRKLQPMVLTLIRRENERVTTWDVTERCVKKYIYRQPAYSLCFEAAGVELYGKDNLTNGYFRPYDGTNLWVADGVENEFICIDLKSPQCLEKLVITFDSGFNREYKNALPHDYNVMPETVRNFDVYLLNNGAEEHVCEVKDNYKRVRTLPLYGKEADSVKIVFRATNGTKNVRVFGVSLYGEKQ